MSLYCGIDLHSTNHLVAVTDETDKRLFEKRLPNDVSFTVEALAPYRDELAGIAIESTFNWYWLIDGLQDAGFSPCLANPAAIKQYEGLKYTDDSHDAFYLAQLMRLGILPTGYLIPASNAESVICCGGACRWCAWPRVCYWRAKPNLAQHRDQDQQQQDSPG